MTHYAINSAKTHCPKGHALTEGNLEPAELKRGMRLCSTCRRERQRVTHKRSYQRIRVKKLARVCANHAIGRGEIIRLPCEVCGSVKVEAHHDDYAQPLNVRFLCPKHHRQHHKEN